MKWCHALHQTYFGRWAARLRIQRHIPPGSPNQQCSLTQKDFKFIPAMLPSASPASKAPAQGHLLIFSEHTMLLPLPTPKAGHEIYVEGGAKLMRE